MNKLLSILLQKSDPGFPWGFEVVGGKDKSVPLTIHVVKSGTLASQYLQPGDRVLQINERDSALLAEHEATQLILQPSKCLELLILKSSTPPSGEGSRNSQLHKISKPPKYQSPRSSHVFEDISEEVCTSEKAFRSENQHVQSNYVQQENYEQQSGRQTQRESFSRDGQCNNVNTHQNLESKTSSHIIENERTSHAAESNSSYYTSESQLSKTQNSQVIPNIPPRRYTSERKANDERGSNGATQTYSTVEKSEQQAHHHQTYLASSDINSENRVSRNNTDSQRAQESTAPWRNSNRRPDQVPAQENHQTNNRSKPENTIAENANGTQYQNSKSQNFQAAELESGRTVASSSFRKSTASYEKCSKVQSAETRVAKSQVIAPAAQASRTEQSETSISRTEQSGAPNSRTEQSKTPLSRTDQSGTPISRTDQSGVPISRTEQSGTPISVADLRSFLPRSTYPKLKQPKDFQPKLSNYYENFKLRSGERIQRSISEPSGSQAPSLSSTPDAGAMHPEPVPPRHESRTRLTDPYSQFFNDKRRTFHEGETFAPLSKSFFRSSNPQLNEESKSNDRSWRASSYCEGTDDGGKTLDTRNCQTLKRDSRTQAQTKSAKYVRCNSSIPFFHEDAASGDTKESGKSTNNTFYSTTTTSHKPRVFPFPVESSAGNTKEYSREVVETSEEYQVGEASREDCFSPYDNLSDGHGEGFGGMKKSTDVEEVFQPVRGGKIFNRATQRWEFSATPVTADPSSSTELNQSEDHIDSNDTSVTGYSYGDGIPQSKSEQEYRAEKSVSGSSMEYRDITKENVSSKNIKSSITKFSDEKRSDGAAVILNNRRINLSESKTDDSKLHSNLQSYLFEESQKNQHAGHQSTNSAEETNLESTNFDVYINRFDTSVNSEGYSKYQSQIGPQTGTPKQFNQENSNARRVDPQYSPIKIENQSQSISSDSQDDVCFNEIKYNLSKICNDGARYTTAAEKMQTMKNVNFEKSQLKSEANISQQNYKNLEQVRTEKQFVSDERDFYAQSQSRKSNFTTEQLYSENSSIEQSSIAERSVYKENQFYENFMTADQHDITRHFQHVFSNPPQTVEESKRSRSPEKTKPVAPSQTIRLSPEKPNRFSPERSAQLKPATRTLTNIQDTAFKSPEKEQSYQTENVLPPPVIPNLPKETKFNSLEKPPPYQPEKVPPFPTTDLEDAKFNIVETTPYQPERALPPIPATSHRPPIKPTANENKSRMDPAPWRRQSQQIAANNTPSYSIHTDAVDGAPPPPPPPLTAGTIPAVRLKSEIPERGKEPPAAIQNAMMTKDKKPFTYTPGGLDLSEIRSPRMARRITRNQMNPEVAHLPPTPQETQQASPRQPLPPAALAAMQPALPVSVFPQQQIPITKQYGKANSSSAAPPPAPPAPPPMSQEPKFRAPVSNGVTNGQRFSTPSSEMNTNQSRVNQAPGSLYIPPLTKQDSGAPQSPPWMQRQNSTPKEVPVWVHRETAPSPTFNQQPRIVPTQVDSKETSSSQGNTRIIPIKIEVSQPQYNNQISSPLSPQTQNPSQQYQQQSHQYQQQSPQYQQQSPQYQQSNHQYQQPSQQYHQPSQQYQQPSQQYQQQNQVYQQVQQPQQQQQQQQQQQRWPVYVPNKFNQPQSPTNENGGPIQSRSFKVLQKITDTDNNEGIRQDYPDASTYNTAGVPLSQLRKMHLSDDDKALMDKVKSQVTNAIEHPEEAEQNPRYRGSNIPSRVFKILDDSVPKSSGNEDYSQNSPVRSGTPQYEQANGHSRQFVPASQQEHVQEPRKYTGGTIPSRSFRMLQAMTVHNPDRPGESEY
nr:PREDICTED: uncharacterized protein LOC109034133 isoform X2 [Bemisia tabaci]